MNESADTGEKEDPENLNNEDTSHDEISVIGFGVDAERADALITDSLAKDLIKKNGDVISTSGNERVTVTTEELSDNFTEGDRVDINILKERSLVPADAFQIKIVASGMLDKALYVYANDFTLTAVKMINLEGGETIKVTSIRDKKAQEDKEDEEEQI